MFGGATKKQAAVLWVYNFVAKDKPPAFYLFYPAAHGNQLVILGGFAVAGIYLRYGQRYAIFLKLNKRCAAVSHPLAAAFFQPHQIRGVVYNAHLVGFGVANVKCGFWDVYRDVQF